MKKDEVAQCFQRKMRLLMEKGGKFDEGLGDVRIRNNWKCWVLREVTFPILFQKKRAQGEGGKMPAYSGTRGSRGDGRMVGGKLARATSRLERWDIVSKGDRRAIYTSTAIENGACIERLDESREWDTGLCLREGHQWNERKLEGKRKAEEIPSSACKETCKGGKFGSREIFEKGLISYGAMRPGETGGGREACQKKRGCTEYWLNSKRY